MVELSWMNIARSYLGTHEGVGTADNPKVVELYALVGHPEVKHDSVPWCAAFVGGMLAKASLHHTGTLWALDYAKWGTALKEPIYGCVGVKTRKTSTGAVAGHVGFVVGATKEEIIMLSGNAQDSVSIAAFPRSNFVAFRWPSEYHVPAIPSPLPTTVAGARVGGSEA